MPVSQLNQLISILETHIRKGEIDFILLTNEGEETIVTKVYIKRGCIYEIWDAKLGKVERGLLCSRLFKVGKGLLCYRVFE